MTQGLIVVKQLPVIEERLKSISEEIDKKIALADSLVCSEDTVKQVKTIRAELNKESGALEDERKAVKAAVMAPYNQFEAVYKQYVSDKYKAADSRLKQRIDDVEGELKREKYDAVKDYFDEYRASLSIDFISMDSWKPNVTLSISLKKLKEEAKAYIDRVAEDLALIETQEHKPEILVEYKRSLNISQAITAVTERHKALEVEAARQAEFAARRAAEAEVVAKVEEAAPASLAPPRVVPAEEAQMTLTFRVTATKARLRELKQFLDNGGYQYE